MKTVIKIRGIQIFPELHGNVFFFLIEMFNVNKAELAYNLNKANQKEATLPFRWVHQVTTDWDVVNHPNKPRYFGAVILIPQTCLV
jgi:hypothetical protein